VVPAEAGFASSHVWLPSPVPGSLFLPHLPFSLPNPFIPCGPDMWEEEVGIPLGKSVQLPQSCKCQNTFALLKSP